MIQDVEIENFRCFAKFRHGGFSRVNLIVGKNNSGKTALLEALEAVASGSSAYAFYRASFDRGEVRVAHAPNEYAVDARRWFHGQELQANSKLSIRANSNRLWLIVEVVDQLAGQPQTGKLWLQRSSHHTRAIAQMSLPIARNTFLGVGDPSDFLAFGETLSQPVVFRSTRRTTLADLGPAWAKIVLTPEEDEVVRALQILEPRAQRMAITGSNGDATAQVRLKDESQPVPLATMGEGMTRMLSLAVALVTARGGYLFIDEIESGLHHSVHLDLWRFVVQTARRLEVQVFATTHSKDCLSAIARLHETAAESAADVTVHRLEAKRPTAVRMDADVIEKTLEADIEVR